MEYNEFRKMFFQKMDEIREEKNLGLLLFYAEGFPYLVKKPYEFLIKQDTQRKEKIRLIKAVYEIAGKDTEKTLSYIMETPREEDFYFSENPSKFIKDFFVYLSSLYSDARHLIEEAKNNGFDTSLEEKIIREEYEGFDDAAYMGAVASHFIEELKKYERMDSRKTIQ